MVSAIDRNAAIVQLRADILRDCAGRMYSDAVQEKDGRTLQYVDLVMEGGGVLGIALLGYVHALETAGIRFLSLGGTSAGSILTLLMAACGEKDEEKAPKLSDIVWAMDMSRFIDGKPCARELSLLLGTEDAGPRWTRAPRMLWYGIWVVRTVLRQLGLNPGSAFQNWLDENLRSFGTPTLAAMCARIDTPVAGLRHRDRGDTLEGIGCELGIVAADLSTETKAVFPKMAPMYWADPGSVSPAEFVRASMSIPLFFQPYRVDVTRPAAGSAALRRKAEDVQAAWDELASYTGEIPDVVTFADGGIMSNFPIALFHSSGIPLAPTFGIKLGPRERRVNAPATLSGYGGAMFNAMRHFSDYDFLIQNPDYKHLIGHIDTRGHNWLNFFMDSDEKVTLFRKGMEAAYAFMMGFQWQEYKRIREGLRNAGAKNREVRTQDDAIARAAAALAPLYGIDDELTAFRALDGEPFA